MAKRLTRFILLALVLGIIAGWAINAAIDDGTPASAERLKSIADYLSIVTALFLRLIKMIIAPLGLLDPGRGHRAHGRHRRARPRRHPLARLVHPRQPRLADARPDPRQRRSTRASASTCRCRRRPPRAASRPPPSTSRISSRHLVPAVDLRGDEHQRDPADRHLLALLRGRADRRRRARASRSSAASKRWSG